ncbi:hypothetical protein CBL_07217 [Carabus blaptoides fortunei]
MNLEQLLHPELLNENELRNVLNERFIRVDNMEHLSKDELLNLFYRIATPLQQRTRNDNRKVNGEQITAPTFATKTNKLLQKPTTENENCNKKIKLCNNKLNNSVNHKVHLKRTYDNKSVTDNDVPTSKKARQKICWP